MKLHLSCSKTQTFETRKNLATLEHLSDNLELFGRRIPQSAEEDQL